MKYSYSLFTALILTIILGFIFMKDDKKNEIFIFGTSGYPFSSDPLDYDYYIHHYAFSSVFSKLISSEKSGGFVPMIASEWKNSNNFKTWSFKIRKDLSFSNGDKITIDDVLLNFKRISFLKKNKNSKSGMLEFLKGFQEIKDLNGEIKGLRIEDDLLVFEFTKPMPNLLDVISFGFYGIAHPSQFDNNNGIWLDKKKAISSGAYEVSLWDENNYELKFRNHSKLYQNDNSLKTIKFVLITNLKTASDLDKLDFLVADKASLLVDDRFEYIGSSNNLKIGYARCNTWNIKESPFNNIDNRKWFRSLFYNNLKKNNFAITNSFFPLTLKNLKEFNADFSQVKPNFKHFDLVTHPISFSGKIIENSDKKSIAELISEALFALGQKSGASLLEKDYPTDEKYDVSITGTGIESVDYLETVRFMFLSKEGIKLPDSTGKILKELAQKNPDINIINREIWDQAIIWPIRHYSSGYWFKKESNIDYGQMNFDSASIDFQFLTRN